ncbi:hypothetical protein KEM56_003935 [Ascosphaera pollenicola]|nr:hypothetical protein KEM56_003935 [Ascosphaera pollenicola]
MSQNTNSQFHTYNQNMAHQQDQIHCSKPSVPMDTNVTSEQDESEMNMNLFGSSFEEPHFLAQNHRQHAQKEVVPPRYNPNASSGMGTTAPFLANFSLVAEAAKRAQLAVMTRDLEGISLS